MDMKTNRQKTNWWVDALLFLGFIGAFFLNISGVALHQFLGLASGLVAAFHLITHWDWVKAVTRRLLGQTSNRSRLYYAVDAALMLGFALMTGSGIMISTWLELPLDNYALWKNTHVAASLMTLVFAVVKIALHWRWIVDTANKHIFKPVAVTHTAPVRQTARTPSRRDFLKLAGLTGVAALVAASKALGALDKQPNVAQASEDQNTVATASDHTTQFITTFATPDVSASAEAALYATQAQANDVPAATATGTAAATIAVQPSATIAAPATAAPVVSACTVRCDKGCSFPGRCRRYVDTNNNNLCDNGECL
jgi:hypothetical protein